MHMKKLIVFTSLAISCIAHSIAQTNDISKIREGEPALNEGYRFAQFIQGLVYDHNGNMSAARLNYNLLAGEMHFIDDKGDTLAISSPENISSIVLDTTRYYYLKPDYFEVFSKHGSIELLGRLRIKQEKEKIGAYGTTSRISSIQSYNSIAGSVRVFALTPNERVRLFADVSYYLIDQKHNGRDHTIGWGKAVKVNKSGLKKMFPTKKESIDKYLKEHSMNFEDLGQIQQMLVHLASL